MNCKSPGEIAAALQQHEAEINGFADVTARGYAAQRNVVSDAKARLAAELGMDERFVDIHIPMDELREKASDLTRDIMSGTAPGSRDPGFNLQAAYDAIVNQFVQERRNAYNSVNALQQQLPENVKSRWQSDYVTNYRVPPLTPEQLLAVANVIDAGKIMGAFGKVPIVEYSPTNEVLKASGAIEYRLQGRPTLTNEWETCPSFGEPGDANRFFRVKVTWGQ